MINIKLKDFLKRGDFDKYKIDIKTYNADEEHNCVIIPQLCYCDYVYKLNNDFILDSVFGRDIKEFRISVHEESCYYWIFADIYIPSVISLKNI